jgi:Holliday junction resolvase RusA-like endonuclease
MNQPESIELFVVGVPKGQPRPRAFARNGLVRMYEPGTAENWKSCIADEWRRTVKEPVKIVGPVMMELQFAMPRPKSHFNSKGVLRAESPSFFDGKPDADNLAKAVMDALTQLQVWKDDSQVAVLHVQKFYSPPASGFVGCHIIIRELPDMRPEAWIPEQELFAPVHRREADTTS